MKKITRYIGLFTFVFTIFSCEQEQLEKPMVEKLVGTWDPVSKEAKEYVDGELVGQEKNSSVNGELTFNIEGGYNIDDSGKQFEFANASRSTNTTAPNGGPPDTLGGVYEFVNGLTAIHFDKGQPEFFGELPYLCTIDELNDSILTFTMEVSADPVEVFAYNQGFNSGLIKSFTAIDNYTFGLADGKLIGYAEGYVDSTDAKFGLNYEYYRGLSTGYYQFGGVFGKPLYTAGYNDGYLGSEGYDLGEIDGEAATLSTNRTYTFTYTFKKVVD